MSDETVRTIDEPGRARLTVRGSRFLGIVAPAATRAAADDAVDDARAAHPDATHVVSAYRIRGDSPIAYADDDGEPHGSAGRPLLSVLTGAELENVVGIVVRYYGGTDLGIGGLVRAYGEVATRALADATVVDREPQVDLIVRVEYDDSGTVRSILESCDVAFDAAYESAVTFRIRVPVSTEDSLRDRILSATHGRAAIDSG